MPAIRHVETRKAERFNISQLTDVVSGFLGDKAQGIQLDQLTGGLQDLNLDPSQLQELIGGQVDLEALGLQDINFADLSTDQIFQLLSEKGVDVSQLDLSALTENGQIGDLIGNAIDGFLRR